MKRKQAIKKSKKIQRLAKGQAMGVYTIRLPQELIAYCENVGSDKIREMINYNKQAGAGHTDVVMDDKNNPHLYAQLSMEEDKLGSILCNNYCYYKSKIVDGKVEIYALEDTGGTNEGVEALKQFMKEVEDAHEGHWWRPDPLTDAILEEAYLIASTCWDERWSDSLPQITIIDRCQNDKELWRQTYVKLRLYNQIWDECARINNNDPMKGKINWKPKKRRGEEFAIAWQAQKKQWREEGKTVLV